MTDLVQKKGWKESTKKEYDRGVNGLDNTIMAEGMPIYREASCEVIVNEQFVKQKKLNSYIILGRDRPAAKSTGYGGKGASHAASIRLVAGLQGQDAADLDKSGNVVYADPNNKKDAAFIYISQKTDMDENFGIKPQKADPAGTNKYATGWDQSETKSGIGLKADNIRMIARQKIKLVTGTDDKLSTGGNSTATYGIDLIAGNDPKDLQPIVKGDNLIDCLSDMKKEISKLNGILAGFINYQKDFNILTMNHYHITTLPLMPATPTMVTPGDPLAKKSPELILKMITRSASSLRNQKYNLDRLEKTYLQRGHAKKDKTKYINSLYNHVN